MGAVAGVLLAKGTAVLLDAALSAFAAGVERSAISELVQKREDEKAKVEDITAELKELARESEEKAQQDIDEAARAAAVKV